ncbi:CGNR zinc finger domain-containing protein [Streptomyces sp. NPDC003860]
MNERHPAPGGLALIESLVNTVDLASGVDLLDTEDGRAPFGITAAELPAVRELREALRAACLAHAGHALPDGPAPSALGPLLARAPLLVDVADDGTAALAPADAASLHARVAAAIATAVADGTWQRLKGCEAEDCRWAYFDRSPAGRRRWCSMSVCGARAKMRAYRARGGGRAPE